MLTCRVSLRSAVLCAVLASVAVVTDALPAHAREVQMLQRRSWGTVRAAYQATRLAGTAPAAAAYADDAARAAAYVDDAAKAAAGQSRRFTYTEKGKAVVGTGEGSSGTKLVYNFVGGKAAGGSAAAGAQLVDVAAAASGARVAGGAADDAGNAAAKAAQEAASDAAPKAAADAAQEVASDAAPKAATDAAREAGGDAAPKAATDAAREAGGDAAPKAATDAAQGAAGSAAVKTAEGAASKAATEAAEGAADGSAAAAKAGTEGARKGITGTVRRVATGGILLFTGAAGGALIDDEIEEIEAEERQAAAGRRPDATRPRHRTSAAGEGSEERDSEPAGAKSAPPETTA